MTKSTKIALNLLILVLFTSCSYEFPTNVESDINIGDLDANSISILGSDMSSGLSDAALHDDGQMNSYSALLANHLGLEDFEQFDINSTNGLNIFAFENTTSVAGKYELSFRNEETPWVTQVALDGAQVTPFDGSVNTVNNLSIPGVKSFQLDNATELSGNTYFDRLNVGPGKSLLDLSIESSPSLVILEMGMHDIFDYAVKGASGDSDPNPASIGEDDLTPTSTFETSINNAVNRILNESSADIFLFTIPDPTKLPYFDTLPWYFTVEEFSNLAFNHLTYYTSYNLDVLEYNGTVDFTRYRPVIAFDVLGGRTFKSKVIVDEYLSDAMTQDNRVIPKYRQMTADDLFLYNAEKIHYESMQTTTAFGTTTPIPDEYIITEAEIEVITERRTEFNEVIEDIADNSDRVHLIDLNELIENIEKGEVIFNGITLNLSFDYKTILSADGFNFNSKGQALIANELIKAINRDYNAAIPIIDINKFQGIKYQ
jgi:hypothetical protein